MLPEAPVNSSVFHPSCPALGETTWQTICGEFRRVRSAVDYPYANLSCCFEGAVEAGDPIIKPSSLATPPRVRKQVPNNRNSARARKDFVECGLEVLQPSAQLLPTPREQSGQIIEVFEDVVFKQVCGLLVFENIPECEAAL